MRRALAEQALGKAVLAAIGLRLLLVPRFHGANSVLFAARPGPRPDYRIVRTVWWVSQLASMITSNVALLFPVALLTTLVAFGTWFAVVWNVVRRRPRR